MRLVTFEGRKYFVEYVRNTGPNMFACDAYKQPAAGQWKRDLRKSRPVRDKLKLDTLARLVLGIDERGQPLQCQITKG